MKKISKILLLFSVLVGLSACNSDGDTSNSETSSAGNSGEAQSANEEVEDLNGNGFTINQDIPESDKPETQVIRWAVVPNGNVMYEIAKDKGYFEEYGIEVVDTNIAIEGDSFSALNSDKVDILSGSGTSGPLRQIAAGNDFTIFGGHMVEGSQAVFTRNDVEWNGIEDFKGKKYAGLPTAYWLTKPMLEAGMDPLEDVEWVQLPNTTDNIAAVQSGEVDFASIVTSQHYQVENMNDIKIIAYSDDFMDNHSCCRMLTHSDFVKNNPNTIKAIHKGLIRAKRDFDADREASVPLMAEAIGSSEEHVGSFLLNEEHFTVSADPLRNILNQAWDTLFETGFLGEEAADIDFDSHVNTDLYEEALNELIEERGEEDPEYYKSQLEIFEYYNK